MARDSPVAAARGGWCSSRPGAAALVTDTLQGILQGVEPTDQTTFVLSGVAVVALAVMASLLPAWRAGRIDPVETLKAE